MLVRHCEAWRSRIYGWTVVNNRSESKGAGASAIELSSRSIEQRRVYSARSDRTVQYSEDGTLPYINTWEAHG